MNLYKISQSVNDNYDTYSDAVVVAENEEDAKLIYPDNYYAKTGKKWYESEDPFDYSSWALPKNIKVELVGTAADNLKAGTVVCASFHAG